MASIPVRVLPHDAEVLSTKCKKLEQSIATAIKAVWPKHVDAIVTVQFTGGQVKVRIQPPDSGWIS